MSLIELVHKKLSLHPQDGKINLKLGIQSNIHFVSN